MGPYVVAILTISDTASKDASLDKSGPTIANLLAAEGNFRVEKTEIIADEEVDIQRWVKESSDSGLYDWILTTGGTGFGKRDRTPEAIAPLIDRPAPGLVHLLLSSSLQHTPMASLSRPLAGIVNSTLVITLPGSPKAVKENLTALFPVIGHALDLLKGESGSNIHKQMGIQPHPQARSSHPTPKDLPDDSSGPVHVRHSPDEPIGKASVATPQIHDDHRHHHHHHAELEEVHLSQDTSVSITKRHRISPYPMISFDEALGIVLRECRPLKTVIKKVNSKLVGHVLAMDVCAARDVPKTRTTNVDGYALQSTQGPSTYKVVTPANHHLSQPLPAGTIMRVNTGAPIPQGTDAVIMVEDTILASSKRDEVAGQDEEETVTTLEAVGAGENVRQKGSDVTEGTKVCEVGTLIGSHGGELGTLAFVGVTEVEVYRKPVVAILSTGNELVDIQSHQPQSQGGEEQWSGIYDTNRPSLQAALEGLGYEVLDLGIALDTVDDHVRMIRKGLDEADMVITTGGSSMGASDLLKPVIERNLGGKIHFGRVIIKPGKPTTFATIPAEGRAASPIPSVSGKPLFALPGNPASALVMFWMFVVPALRKLGGYPESRCCLPRTQVLLNDDMYLDSRPEFHRVVVRCTPKGLEAFSTGGQRSSRVASLAGANAFIALPSKETGKDMLPKGSFAEAVIIGELQM